MQAGRILLLFLFTFSVAQGQSPYKQSGGPAQGSLRVTVTVEPSVWLVMAADGKQEMVVANAPDSKEAFSHAPSLKNQPKNQLKNPTEKPEDGYGTRFRGHAASVDVWATSCRCACGCAMTQKN